jgi:transcriptional regulator with XRE-family HTH domain
MFERLGLNSQQEYSKLENGKMNFTDDLISKISKSFNISPNEFTNPDAEINRLNNPQANTHNSSDKNEDL